MGRYAGLTLLLMFSLLLVPAVAFWPAVHGPFLLDDQVHFPKLSWASNPEHGLLKYVFNTDNGLGRPLAFLSLLIEDNAWPTDPYPYKRDNLLFHIVNGILVFWLLRLFLSAYSKTKLSVTASQKQLLWVPLLIAVWWVIHPIQLSPTFLTIQRMTVLMGTFSLVGLIAYFYSRKMLLQKPVAAFLLLGLSYFSILIAILFKEPGILTCVYLLILDIYLFRSGSPAESPSATNTAIKYWQFMVTAAGILPLALLIGYYFLSIDKMDMLYFKRDFTMSERLLTQFPVLADYIGVIVKPTFSTLGPFQDHYPVSRSLVSPLYTFFAIALFVGGGLTAIFFAVKRSGFFLFALLWFLVGHLLESTFLPIELYFEHRNYLPMLAIGFAFSVLLLGYWKYIRYSAAVFGVYVVMLLFISHESARTWGSEEKMAIYWAAEKPASMRARFSLAMLYLRLGMVNEAEEELKSASNSVGGKRSPFLIAEIMIESCYKKQSISDEMVEQVAAQIKVAKFEHASLSTMKQLKDLYVKDVCTITESQILELYQAYFGNPKFYGLNTSRQIFNLQLSELYKTKGDLNGFMHYASLAYEAKPRFDIPLTQAYYLGDAGLYEDALCFYELAKRSPDSNKFSVFYRRQTLARYWGVLSEMAAKNGVKLDSLSCPDS